MIGIKHAIIVALWSPRSRGNYRVRRSCCTLSLAREGFRKMRTVTNGASLALVLTLAACGSTTGILPVGPGTYTITERFATIRGGSDTAKTDALTQANAYCAQQGKQLMSTNMKRETGSSSWCSSA
jgi:putative hemolysin